MSNKQYLGDSVYVREDDGMIVLTTENGGPASNTILLDYHVYKALTRWVEQSIREAQEREEKYAREKYDIQSEDVGTMEDIGL